MTRAGQRTGGSRLDLSPGTKKVLELAVDEARRLGHHYIGTEHLLLGLVRQDEGVAIDVLKRLGVKPDDVRRQTRRVIQENPSSTQPSSRPSIPGTSASSQGPGSGSGSSSQTPCGVLARGRTSRLRWSTNWRPT